MVPRFRLQRPQEIDEALAAYAETDGDAAYIAGGTELLQVMKMGLAEFETLIDVKRIEELRGIHVEADGTLRIGATTTHRDIERSPEIAFALPALIKLERGLANLRVRSTGTLGGNIAFAEPHSDPATLLLVCDASVDLIGPTGRREVPMSEFTVGPLFTVREPDEIVTSLRIPARQKAEGTAYDKVKFFERPAVSLAVRVRVNDGAISACDVAVGSITDTPMLISDAGDALVGTEADARALDAALDRATSPLQELDAVEDHNGSADYKRHLAAVLMKRVAHGALEEAVNRA